MRKILTILIICIMLLTTSVYATVNTGLYDPGTVNVPTPMKDMGNTIIGTLQVVGTIIAVCSLLMIAIRLMLAAPSEKAALKERLVPFIVGVVMLFAIVNLVGIVYNLMK